MRAAKSPGAVAALGALEIDQLGRQVTLIAKNHSRKLRSTLRSLARTVVTPKESPRTGPLRCSACAANWSRRATILIDRSMPIAATCWRSPSARLARVPSSASQATVSGLSASPDAQEARRFAKTHRR